MTFMKIARKQLTSIGIAMALIFIAGSIFANTNPQEDILCVESGDDISGTFVEGPHVFYKKGKVCIKNIHFSSGKAVVKQETFNSPKEVPSLRCKVDDKKGTSFKFSIKHKHEAPPTVYPQPEKLYAISDIEGNFETFKQSLFNNGVIDKNMSWSFGKGHLVLVGDFFDRGYNVTAVLWLVYKLEQEAEQKGGMVHFIIGNHEEMNMRGDVRYVKEKYIKAAKSMKMPYKGLFSVDSELGRWLRSKNVVEKIGKTIFVHGGISPEMANSRIRLEDMNKYARQYYGMDKFRLEQKGGGGTAVFSKIGPMWYRGYFREKLSQESVNKTLDLYGAKYVVVGHTIVPRVSSLFEGRVIAIDVKQDIALSAKITNSLYYHGNKIMASNVDGEQTPVEIFMTEDVVVNVFKAIKHGDLTNVKSFVKTSDQGDRINKHYFSKRITLLQAAIHHDQQEVVQFLIDEGANLDMLSENKTPLMHAAEKNNQYIIDLLIKEGANINALNKQKKTTLFYCAKHGNVEMAQMLVKNGANIKLKDGKGRTAAEYALKNDNKKVAVFLQSCKER